MGRYFVSFGQFFEAESKQDAYNKGMYAIWGNVSRYGVWVEEVPEGSKAVCIDVDPSTGLKHWEGADQ